MYVGLKLPTDMYSKFYEFYSQCSLFCLRIIEIFKLHNHFQWNIFFFLYCISLKSHHILIKISFFFILRLCMIDWLIWCWTYFMTTFNQRYFLHLFFTLNHPLLLLLHLTTDIKHINNSFHIFIWIFSFLFFSSYYW